MSRWLMLSLVVIASVAAMSGYLCWHRADYYPAEVATHWDINGKANDQCSRDNLFMVFGIFPTMMLAVYALLLVLPWLSPAQFKIDMFRPIYDYIVFLITALFAYLAVVIAMAQISGEMSNAWMLGGMFLFFGLLGNVLGKVRKNFWVGVRTPWTLASDVVWERTHRLAAWLFVAAGLGGFVATLLGAPALYCIPALVAAGLVPVIYSLVLYKRLEKRGQLVAPQGHANGANAL